MAEWDEEWSKSKLGKDYGDVFYRRAIGELPEMESSKAAARRVLADFKAGETLLDVGCGAGHYLRSIRNAGAGELDYTGVDATEAYVELARDAFQNDGSAQFVQGDIFQLPFGDKSFDVVMCNNVLLHLPNVARPLAELCRVAKRRLLVRTLVGPKSYVVKDVAPQADGADFDADCEPTAFHFLNIYSEAYLSRLLGAHAQPVSVSFESDRDFAADAVADTGQLLDGAWDATRVIAGMQVTGAIILPWTFVDVSFTTAE